MDVINNSKEKDKTAFYFNKGSRNPNFAEINNGMLREMTADLKVKFMPITRD